MDGGFSAEPTLKTRFQIAVDRLFAVEGGLVDNPADPGGVTKYGISLRFLVAEGRLPANRALCDVDANGLIDGRDVRALTRPQAAALYRRCFWEAEGIGQLPPPLDAMMLDQCVNMGSGTAIRLLQSAVGAKTDGQLGPKTEAAVERSIATVGMDGVIAAYKRVARDHYAAIIAAHPRLACFAEGWDARVDRLGAV